MSTQQMEVYKCEVCGLVVEVLEGGAGELICCGQRMVRMDANAMAAAHDKHVPVVEQVAGGLAVSVGGVPHPMEAKHFIEWIELSADGMTCRRFLQPGEPPRAVFPMPAPAGKLTVRAYCNLHGLWKA